MKVPSKKILAFAVALLLSDPPTVTYAEIMETPLPEAERLPPLREIAVYGPTKEYKARFIRQSVRCMKAYRSMGLKFSMELALCQCWLESQFGTSKVAMQTGQMFGITVCPKLISEMRTAYPLACPSYPDGDGKLYQPAKTLKANFFLYAYLMHKSYNDMKATHFNSCVEELRLANRKYAEDMPHYIELIYRVHKHLGIGGLDADNQ